MPDPWWQTPPVDWTRPEPRQVRDLLGSAYDERDAIKRVAQQVGLRWAKAPGGDASAETLWTWILDAGIAKGVLFDLCGQVLADDSMAAFHASLRHLFGGGFAMGYAHRLPPGGPTGGSLESIRDEINGVLAGAASDASGGLQSINRAILGFTDAQADIQMTTDSLRRTAMIRVGGQPAGTGFLVGPDLLLTAAHVLDKRHWPPEPAGPVEAVFDFVAAPGRSPEEIGVSVGVAEFVAGSLPSVTERSGNLDDWNAPEPFLDFVLMRLQRAIATDSAPSRGFYELHTEAYLFRDQAILRVPQHPLGQTQVTSLMSGPFALNPNGTRIRYSGNTLPGSSGSAVLDLRGRLVALHHLATNTANQAVPIDKIATAIAAAGISLPRRAPAPVVGPSTHASPEPTSGGQDAGGGTNPFATTRVGRRPFANRKTLRRLVRDMLRPNGGNILVIDGGPDSGKSHSWRYFAHLEQFRDHQAIKGEAPEGVRAVRLDLERFKVPRSKLYEELLKRICQKMGLRTQDKLAQPPKTVSDLVSTLDAQLFDTKTVWWLVFDSLDKHKPIDPNVNELISELGRLLDEKPGLPLRLVLCSRDRVELPDDIGDYAQRDSATGLDRDDVEDWLRRRAAEQGRTVDEAALTAKLAELFPPGTQPSPTKLAPKLLRAVDDVVEGHP